MSWKHWSIAIDFHIPKPNVKNYQLHETNIGVTTALRI